MELSTRVERDKHTLHKVDPLVYHMEKIPWTHFLTLTFRVVPPDHIQRKCIYLKKTLSISSDMERDKNSKSQTFKQVCSILKDMFFILLREKQLAHYLWYHDACIAFFPKCHCRVYAQCNKILKTKQQITLITLPNAQQDHVYDRPFTLYISIRLNLVMCWSWRPPLAFYWS